MKIKIGIVSLVGIIYLSISGCLYRGDGVFKKIGDSDYKAKINVMNLFVAADGRPTCICGAVLLEDHITPLRNTHIILKKKNQQEIISNTNTDNSGAFNMTGLYSNDYYTLEVDSPDYFAKKTIMIEPNKNNWHEIFANKR
jgi:hypothetical protein